MERSIDRIDWPTVLAAKSFSSFVVMDIAIMRDRFDMAGGLFFSCLGFGSMAVTSMAREQEEIRMYSDLQVLLSRFEKR
ncbi:MAG: hypothetical protein WC686_05265 [Candidatus Shapirobacteria bacterium]|jgi:hypothetical protein